MREKCLFDTLWDMHVVEHLSGGNDLLAMDRIYLHDLCGTFSFQCMDASGHTVLDPSRVYATPDHTLSSKPGRTDADSEMSALIMPAFREGCRKRGITLFDDGERNQGIVHIVGPETGLSLPGMTIACGDSHTCTHGALGALAMGVGTNMVYHALATSCLIAKRPKTMSVELTGTLQPGVDSMDIILYILSRYGISFGAGYAIEYRGEVIRNMPVEDRFTICNLTIESGAEYGLISPDDNTLEYIREKQYAPAGTAWDALEAHCREIATTENAHFDKYVKIDVSGLTRQISWGINPGHTICVTDCIPEITEGLPGKVSEGYQKAYEYMDLAPGQPITGVPIQRVFIGSCSNGRLSSLEKAAHVVEGKHVKEGVQAWIVPGSERVKAEAEALGYDRIFKDAGFLWGEPCCSLCVGSNGEVVAPGQRCVSTTNRNFIGRQGRGARTHLASVVTAAMAAISGEIC